jgi:hypothetical protein
VTIQEVKDALRFRCLSYVLFFLFFAPH